MAELERAPGDAANGRVQPGRVATTGQDSNSHW
jgi:hypothetical protein